MQLLSRGQNWEQQVHGAVFHLREGELSYNMNPICSIILKISNAEVLGVQKQRLREDSCLREPFQPWDS